MDETEMKEDINQLKEQMAKIQETLEKLTTAGVGPSTVNEEEPQGPPYPHGFGPMHYPSGVTPLTAYAGGQSDPQYQWPPYGLPAGYTPPVMVHPPVTDPPHAYAQTFVMPPVFGAGIGQPQAQSVVSAPIPQVTTSIPVQENAIATTIHVTQGPSGHPHQVVGGSTPNLPSEESKTQEKWQAIEDRLKAVEGASHGLADAYDLCLVSNLVIPPKFKVPDFDKYKGTTCPKSHLTMYCRKMATHAHDDKLLIHFFQDSLTGATLNWYNHLDRARIRCWNDIRDAFLKQYKYNLDMAPDRLELKSMVKRDVETFKEYAQRWRELAAQVDPPLTEREITSLFIDTLHSPYYDLMIGCMSSNFSDMVTIGERVESGIRSRKIALELDEVTDEKE